MGGVTTERAAAVVEGALVADGTVLVGARKPPLLLLLLPHAVLRNLYYVKTSQAATHNMLQILGIQSIYRHPRRQGGPMAAVRRARLRASHPRKSNPLESPPEALLIIIHAAYTRGLKMFFCVESMCVRACEAASAAERTARRLFTIHFDHSFVCRARRLSQRPTANS